MGCTLIYCICSMCVHIRGIDYDYGLHLYTRKGVVLVVRLLVHHSCQKKIKGKGLHIKDFHSKLDMWQKKKEKTNVKRLGMYKCKRWIWWENPGEVVGIEPRWWHGMVAGFGGLTNMGMGIPSYGGYTWAYGVGWSMISIHIYGYDLEGTMG